MTTLLTFVSGTIVALVLYEGGHPWPAAAVAIGTTAALAAIRIFAQYEDD